MTTQQKAIFVREVGKPVELGERDVPSPQDGEVLLKVAATMRPSPLLQGVSNLLRKTDAHPQYSPTTPTAATGACSSPSRRRNFPMCLDQMSPA